MQFDHFNYLLAINQKYSVYKKKRKLYIMIVTRAISKISISDSKNFIMISEELC